MSEWTSRNTYENVTSGPISVKTVKIRPVYEYSYRNYFENNNYENS